MGRPTSVLVFGILNILAAGLGVCGVGGYVFMRSGVLQKWLEKMAEGNPAMQNNPALQLLETNAGYRIFVDITSILGAIGIIVLLASAIGLLTTKPWARVVTIGYGVYRILMVTLMAVVTYVLVHAPTLEQASGLERRSAVLGLVGLVVGSGIAIAYWLVQILFLTRPSVVAAFADQGSDWEDDVEASTDLPWQE